MTILGAIKTIFFKLMIALVCALYALVGFVAVCVGFVLLVILGAWLFGVLQG